MRCPQKIIERKLQGDHAGLWENREALEKYLARLKELMEADEEIKNGTSETDAIPKVPADTVISS